MDPFYTTSMPASAMRSGRARHSPSGDRPPSVEPSERHKAEPQPQAPAASGLKSAAAGLRRSAGLFNLKLDAENSRDSENLDAPDASYCAQRPADVPKPYGALAHGTSPPRGSAMPMTPDASIAGAMPATAGRRRANTLSLKRPHPFSSGKPAKSGFLSRSSASHHGTASPAGQKRLHLTTSDDDRSLYASMGGIGGIGNAGAITPAAASADVAVMTPELSFRGAKPVQTAFTSAGLQSKKHVPQTPKPRVPETPCKRPINDSLLGKDVSPSTHFAHSISHSLSHPMSHAMAESMAHHAVHAHHAVQAAAPNPEEEASPTHESPSARFMNDSLLAMRAPLYTKSRVAENEDDPNSLPASMDDVESPLGHHPVDRLQRFSLGQLHTDELEPPETPTRFGLGGSQHIGHGTVDGIDGLVQTSTPLSRYSIGAGRQSSEAAATATPGTLLKPRPLPAVLQSIDPADSLSVSPTESLDLDASTAASSSSLSDTSVLTNLSPRTPDVKKAHVLRSNSIMRTVTSQTSTESQASPRPRRNLRFLGLRADPYTSPHPRKCEATTDEPPIPQSLMLNTAQTASNAGGAGGAISGGATGAGAGAKGAPSLPSLPPMRVETPLGSMHAELSPRTPVSHVATLNSLSNDVSMEGDTDHFGAAADTSAVQSAHHPHDALVAAKFDRVLSSAFGEFSAVFVVAQGKQRFAVKRTKRPMLSQPQRLRRREEVDILRTLAHRRDPASDSQEDSAADAHIVQLVDEWEAGSFGYIMTEYCENGDLSRFLADQGRISRLEEWRVWKILSEVLQGLAVIHQHDILHLDLKPANVFVTFEGHLKIGDFGMATRFPVPRGFEREGDREYIAPEVLERQQYGKEADIFSVGLMMVEVAANIVLPDNGVHWHRLRSGDLSDAGRLSSGDVRLANHRTENGDRPPPWAPQFLVDDKCLLDTVVSQMLDPRPEKRLTVEQLLQLPELELVNQRGQAGAVVYEGEYGPEPESDDEISVWQRA